MLLALKYLLSATFPTSPNTENLNMFFALLLQLNLTGINKVIASNHNIVDYTTYMTQIINMLISWLIECAFWS